MTYTIIGGLNGVGKSTVYSLLSDKEKEQLGRRINVDEIVAEMGPWQDTKLQTIAGKHAVKNIKDCLNSKQNFHQETTLAGISILNTVKTAKEKGFYICLWYMYVKDVEIAKDRVLSRVIKGGHGVSEALIDKRSKTSIETLKLLIPLCDEVRVYDNTKAFTAVARITNNELKILDKTIPNDILSCLYQTYSETINAK